MADIDALTPDQREALTRFLTAHEQASKVDDAVAEAREERARALVAARQAEVPVALLIEASGLSRSRIFQIRNEGLAAAEA